MFPGTIHDLDEAGALAAIGSVVTARKQAQVDELKLLAHWAMLHGDPQDQTNAVPAAKGGDRLLQLGGEGTPQVAEFCLAEVALARHAGVAATRNAVADALDLQYRLPRFNLKVTALQVEPWVARKIAAMTRQLSLQDVAIVDAALAVADDLHPGALLALAEAKVIEADPDAHRTRIAEDATKVGVWKSRPRPGDRLGDDLTPAEAATGRISAKLPLADLVDLDTAIDDLVAVLAEQPDYTDLTSDQLRAAALSLLAHPDQALALLRGPDAEPVKPLPKKSATIVVHLSADVLAGDAGVARCDDLGPLLLEQVTDLLGHRNVTLQPVIDLNHVHSVNGYEHPVKVRQRTLLRTGGDVFPHSTVSKRVDHDHVTPYDPLGPPGQSGDMNDAPLTRFHHRVKTHCPGWQTEQIALGAYRWITPHGLARVVTPRGTKTVDLLKDKAGNILGETYPQSPAIAVDFEL